MRVALFPRKIQHTRQQHGLYTTQCTFAYMETLQHLFVIPPKHTTMVPMCQFVKENPGLIDAVAQVASSMSDLNAFHFVGVEAVPGKRALCEVHTDKSSTCGVHHNPPVFFQPFGRDVVAATLNLGRVVLLDPNRNGTQCCDLGVGNNLHTRYTVSITHAPHHIVLSIRNKKKHNSCGTYTNYVVQMRAQALHQFFSKVTLLLCEQLGVHEHCPSVDIQLDVGCGTIQEAAAARAV